MPWPFTNVAAPSFNTGFVDVPSGVLTAVDATNPIWPMGMLFSNDTAALISVIVTNNDGHKIAPDVDVPSKSVLPIPLPFPPTNGLKWQASAPGLKGQLWGYK